MFRTKKNSIGITLGDKPQSMLISSFSCLHADCLGHLKSDALITSSSSSPSLLLLQLSGRAARTNRQMNSWLMLSTEMKRSKKNSNTFECYWIEAYLTVATRRETLRRRENHSNAPDLSSTGTHLSKYIYTHMSRKKAQMLRFRRLHVILSLFQQSIFVLLFQFYLTLLSTLLR